MNWLKYTRLYYRTVLLKIRIIHQSLLKFLILIC